VAAATGGIEEALHLRFGEEVFPAAIDGGALAFYASLRGHSLPYGG
jgi:hypothetical protein